MKKDFWNNWANVNELKQYEFIDFIVDRVIGLDVIKDKKLRHHAITTLLNSYFQDIYDTRKSVIKVSKR